MGRARNAAIVLAWVLSAPAAADEYTDFRIPEHRLFGWTANLSSGAQLFGQGDGEHYGSDRALRGDFFTQGFWTSDADRGRSSIDWSAAAATRRFLQRDQFTFINAFQSRRFFQDNGTTNADEIWRVSLEHRIYPGRSPLALEGALGALGAYDQNWDHRNQDDQITYPAPSQRSLDQTHQVRWTYQTSVFASVALGVGRVRDATGVLDARVFEKRLGEAGVLARPLSLAARQRLAALAYVQYGYASVHDRSGKYFWQELERILREDGAVPDSGVDPAAVMRAAEPYLGSGGPTALIPHSPVARNVGTFAGLVVAAASNHQIQRLTIDRYIEFSQNDTVLAAILNSQSSRSTFSNDALQGGGRIEYHRPLGPRWQVDAEEQALFPLRAHREGFELSSDLTVRAIVSDRWTAGARASHLRSVEHGREGNTESEWDRWVVQLAVDLTVYLEDRVQLVLQARHDQLLDRAPNPFSTAIRTDYRRAADVTLGVTYRFLGGLDAPGLIRPVRIRSRVW